MKKVPYFNNTPQRRVVGGQACAPGATVYVDERDHPDYKPKAAQPVETDPADPVLTLLDGSVADIVPQLPELSDEDLEKVRQGEADGKTRKSLMAAIEEELLRRAEAKVAGGDGDSDDDAPEGGE